MNGSQLEVWAASKAAQNKRCHPNLKPVVLYRNDEANGMGALFTSGGSTVLLTVGHLFWAEMPLCQWMYRTLKPESNVRLPLLTAEPFSKNPRADVAVCTPGTMLHTSPLVPNFFYEGTRWGGELTANIRKPGETSKKLTSTISGERLSSVGEVLYADAPYEALDYASVAGESGTVFWDENDEKTLYILKGNSPEVAKHAQRKKLCRSGNITLALRLSIK